MAAFQHYTPANILKNDRDERKWLEFCRTLGVHPDPPKVKDERSCSWSWRNFFPFLSKER